MTLRSHRFRGERTYVGGRFAGDQGTSEPPSPGGMLIEGAWKQTCVKCGSGNNLRLDRVSDRSIPCGCQKDGIRDGGLRSGILRGGIRGGGGGIHTDAIRDAVTYDMKLRSGGIHTDGFRDGIRSMESLKRPQSARRPFTPSHCYSYSVGLQPPTVPTHAPAGGGGFRTRPPAPPPAAFLAPFRMHHHHHHRSSSLGAPTNPRRSQPERLVLRYTDAGIPKPPSHANAAPPRLTGSGTFPKLVTKYISRQSSKDGTAATYIETFRQQSNNKVAIVTQSFSM